VLYPTLDRLGIARNSRAAGFHTFRHSVATIVNQKTGDLKLVQKLLGHSNLSTTADVYKHTSADADRSAALALERRSLAICSKLFHILEHGTRTWLQTRNTRAHGSARNFNNPGDLQE
jgi:Phage integrase family